VASDDGGEDDAVGAAADRLYAAAPEEFMALRGELAKQARADGNAAAAGRIEKLRKPTVAAWIVNAYVLGDAGAVDRLTDLGDRMRAAQERLDAGKLRELTTERRKLVDELTRAAFRQAGKRQPAAGLRDEVSGTFDAAIADPEIAGRLGRLPRSEQWSGFGFLPTGTPQLTVVRGGRDATKKAPAKSSAAKPPAPPRKSAAERRKERKAVADAEQALAAAEEAFADAEGRQRDLTQRIKQLTRRLAKLQDELDEARDALDSTKQEVNAAKARRRDARSALDRAERAARD
jgi:hypothetical protein